jgi:hypothetical protein
MSNKTYIVVSFKIGEIMTIKIIGTWNLSITSDEMLPNTIYLDGSCRGYHWKPEINSLSLDHHADCTRMITDATCIQVWKHIKLGLDLSSFVQVIIDDIDADTVLSIFLLQNPEQVHLECIKKLVFDIGLVDAHGNSAFDVHPLHVSINPFYKIARTMELLEECIEKVHTYLHKGKCEEKPERKGNFVGFKNGKETYVNDTTFAKMYREYPIVVGYVPQEVGTLFTIGKKSDLVSLDMIGLFKSLGEIEEKVTDAKELLTKNWGGGSSIGGSARYSDQTASRVSLAQVVESVISLL